MRPPIGYTLGDSTLIGPGSAASGRIGGGLGADFGDAGDDEGGLG